MPLNTKLFRKIQKHILEKPRRLAMVWWLQEKTDYEPRVRDEGELKSHEFAECGTAACIAGWAVLLSPKAAKSIDVCEIRKKAERLLGVTKAEGSKLFSVAFWPPKFAQKYWEARTPRAKAKATSERIDYFLENRC